MFLGTALQLNDMLVGRRGGVVLEARSCRMLSEAERKEIESFVKVRGVLGSSRSECCCAHGSSGVS